MGFLKPLSALLALTATPALAHIAADPKEAAAGSYQDVRFRVGHGCGSADTTAVRIEIPEGMASARPQPKPGWALEISREGDRVTAVTWRGLLPESQFDEFALFFKLPGQAGTLYFPAVQTCGDTEAQWTEIPEPGEKVSHPAPSLTLKPAAPAAESHHH